MSYKVSKEEEILEAYNTYINNQGPGACGEPVKTDLKEGEESDLGLHKLRGGKIYSDPLPDQHSPSPPGSPSTLPKTKPSMPDPLNLPNSSTQGTSPPQQQVSALAPIKVIPSDASVREFTYQDDDYNARDFIDMCEFNMRNSGTTADADKIAFVCARVKNGSEASNMMRVSAITKQVKKGVYKDFRERFLKVFGENIRHNLVKGVSIAVERMLEKANAQTPDHAQIGANVVSQDLLKYLRDNKWGDANGMSWDNVENFLEFLVWMIHLQGKSRNVALALDFGPNDELLDFVHKVKKRTVEARGQAAACIAAAVEASNVTTGVAALSLDSARSVRADYKPDNTKSVPICTHCKRVGHLESRCYLLKREKRRNQAKGNPSGDRSCAQGNAKPNRDKRPFSDDAHKRPTSKSGGAGNAYCHLHGTSNHSSDECYTLAKYRREVQEQGNRRGGESSSGEGARPKKHDPT